MSVKGQKKEMAEKIAGRSKVFNMNSPAYKAFVKDLQKLNITSLMTLTTYKSK